jgi:hypothetical protein
VDEIASTYSTALHGLPISKSYNTEQALQDKSDWVEVHRLMELLATPGWPGCTGPQNPTFHMIGRSGNPTPLHEAVRNGVTAGAVSEQNQLTVDKKCFQSIFMI